MSILLTILHVIVCLTLILVILLQAGRGQGLTGASFGGGNVQSLLGTGASDFLTKATTVAAIGFLITSMSLDWMETQKSKSLLDLDRSAAQSVDVNSIKKALDRVKAEAAQKAADDTATSESAIQDTASDLTQKAEGTAQALQETVDSAKQAAQDQADALNS